MSPHPVAARVTRRLAKRSAVTRPVGGPFGGQGGLRTLGGDLGRAVIKGSAVDEGGDVVRQGVGSAGRGVAVVFS